MRNEQDIYKRNNNISNKKNKKLIKRVSVGDDLYYQLKMEAFQRKMELQDYIQLLHVNREYLIPYNS